MSEAPAQVQASGSGGKSQSQGQSQPDASWAAVSSSFFEIRGRLRLDDVALEEVAVVQRLIDVRGRRVSTLWRARSALTVPPAPQ